MAQVLQYYEAQARTNNNRGREAACHCMAELVRKLEGPAISPYLDRIMKALLAAFKDDSWPVSCLLACAVSDQGQLLPEHLCSLCCSVLCCAELFCAVLCCAAICYDMLCCGLLCVALTRRGPALTLAVLHCIMLSPQHLPGNCMHCCVMASAAS